MQAHGNSVGIGSCSSTKRCALKCLNFISLRSLCWPFFFWDELCVFHGCEALSQCIPRAGCKPLFCSKHTSGFLVPFEKPHVKPDLDTPCSLLFSRGFMFLGLSLVGTCFLEGFVFPGAFSICAQSSDFNDASHYTMIALTLKRARVSGYGNGAINLNEDRVSPLSQHAALERGVTACPLTYGKPIPLLQKKVTPSFSSLLPISCYFSYFQPDSLPDGKGEI